MKPSPLRHPAGFLPPLMSLSALAFALGYVATHGVVRHADEGAPARIFQLLLVGQLPLMAWFVAACLPRSPGSTAKVLALQILSAAIPLATVWLLER